MALLTSDDVQTSALPTAAEPEHVETTEEAHFFET